MNTVTIGMCQIGQGYDCAQNLERSLALVDEACAGGARVAVLPEMFFTPYEPPAIKRAASLSGEALERLRERAVRHGVFIVAGSLPWEAPGGKLFNRSWVIGPDGGVVHHHDKLHLFDCTPPGGPPVIESETIEPGDSLGTFETPWGTAAAVVCYDIRFPQLTQVLIEKGVRLIFVPAAFSVITGPAHWEMLVRVRALELQGFVAGVQPARSPSLRYAPHGHSLLASPWGEIILDAGEGETAAVASIDLDRAQAIRDRFPLIEHRRLDLYQTCWKAKP